MSKKNFIYFFIIGVVLMVMLLPLFNYKVDRWRVLHSDYNHLYRNHMLNKTFLKTKYLIEHPNKYDTIVMGSSNGGYIDTTMISKKAYNMKYNFGLLAIHLQNLKTMLKNGVKIKNLWVGISDYIIWKDPKDYENSFERATYKANFFKDIKTYLFYLFKKPDLDDYFLFRGYYPLEYSELITNPTPHLDAIVREKEHFKIANKWKKYMDKVDPILLHYDDSKYRIDEAVNEVKELIEVCKDNNISLTLFMYPVFYKTYLAYNQKRIEEFKRKLALVTPYYDFYSLNDRAYDAMKWQDSMHFAYSTGVYIIKAIKNKQNLVTKDNINTHLKQLIVNRKKYLVNKKGIYYLHYNINFTPSKIIFDIKKDINNTAVNKDIVIKKRDGNIDIVSIGKDPIIYIKPLKVSQKKVFLKIDMNITTKAVFKIYYKDANSNYSENKMYFRHLHKGNNKLQVAIPSKYLLNDLRVDIIDKKGVVEINKFQIVE